jgi:hypothetical protein
LKDLREKIGQVKDGHNLLSSTHATLHRLVSPFSNPPLISSFCPIFRVRSSEVRNKPTIDLFLHPPIATDYKVDALGQKIDKIPNPIPVDVSPSEPDSSRSAVR